MAPPHDDARSFSAELHKENKMLNITRFNPLEDAFENLFRGVPVWLPSPEARASAPTQFRMDVTENDKEYQVLADLPGVKKEDISITISGNQVAVSAEVKHEKDVEKGETMLRGERYYGKIQRAFALEPAPIHATVDLDQHFVCAWAHKCYVAGGGLRLRS
jgi:HSP20 family protein